jgi:hypothetical protein
MTKEFANAHAAWNKLTAEEKAPYLTDEANDKARFEQERLAWIVTHPPKPSRARTAVHYYHKDRPEKTDRIEFQSLSEEVRKQYEQKAAEDKKRYETEVNTYRDYCERSGKNFDDEMKPKKRSASVKASSAKAPTAPKKRKTETTPSTKKRKAEKKITDELGIDPRCTTFLPKVNKKKKNNKVDEDDDKIDEDEKNEKDDDSDDGQDE